MTNLETRDWKLRRRHETENFLCNPSKWFKSFIHRQSPWIVHSSIPFGKHCRNLSCRWITRNLSQDVDTTERKHLIHSRSKHHGSLLRYFVLLSLKSAGLSDCTTATKHDGMRSRHFCGSFNDLTSWPAPRLTDLRGRPVDGCRP
jgi:hypothetical protein